MFRRLSEMETLELFPEKPVLDTRPTEATACVLKDGHHFDPKNLRWSDGKIHCPGCGAAKD